MLQIMRTELIDDLSLEYNRARQAAITQLTKLLVDHQLLSNNKGGNQHGELAV